MMLAAKAAGRLAQTAATAVKKAKNVKDLAAKKAKNVKDLAAKKAKQAVKDVEQKVKQNVQDIHQNIKNNIKTSLKDGLSNTAIQQIVAKALIDAGMLLQRTNATPKKITQQTQDTDTADTDTDNTDAAFGRKKPRKRAIKKRKPKSPTLSHFGWKGSLSTNQRQNVLKKAVKSLGIKGTINKLMMIQRLHRKNKTGQICAKDILYLKKNYKK